MLGAYVILKEPVSSLKLEKIQGTECYDATNSIEGSAIDATNMLARRLNFTIAKQYIRKDRKFGTYLNGNVSMF